jgi:hypothetical protein
LSNRWVDGQAFAGPAMMVVFLSSQGAGRQSERKVCAAKESLKTKSGKIKDEKRQYNKRYGESRQIF